MIAGPASVTGPRLATTTLNVWVALSPVTSVAVSSPEYVPLPWNVCWGFLPKATPPSEKSQRRVGNPHGLVLPDPSNVMGLPWLPAYSWPAPPPESGVGGMLLAARVPRVAEPAFPVKPIARS